MLNHLIVLAVVAGGLGAGATDSSFMAANAVAMERMMAAMSVKSSGDVDADFVAMMEPHHQGAVDMALLELRFGKNEQLRRIAQGIIIEQRQEIVAMRLALNGPARPGSRKPAAPEIEPPSDTISIDPAKSSPR